MGLRNMCRVVIEGSKETKMLLDRDMGHGNLQVMQSGLLHVMGC